MRYPEDFLNKIVCGDCLEVMKHIPNKTVDMVLCDLPYGMTASKWDENLNMNELWKQYNRVLKGVAVLFACQPFTTKLVSSNFKKFRYCWYWLKNQGTNFFHAKHMPIRKIEEICVFGMGKYNPQITEGHAPTKIIKGSSKGKVYNGMNTRNCVGGKTTRYPVNILEFKCVDNHSRTHSAEKPVELCEYLIKTYTDENDIVLDNCVGSGSTIVACANTKRNFIGIEINSEYCKLATNRLTKSIDKI